MIKRFFYKTILWVIVLMFLESCANENSVEQVNQSDRSLNTDSTVLNIIHNYEIPYEDSFPVTFQYVDSLPFVGIRRFETRRGCEGNSTPNWYVEIKKNRDVNFYYTQGFKLPDGGELNGQEKYKAGKFRKILKVDFQYFVENIVPKDFPRYFVITPNYIYEVDSLGHQIFADFCCGFIPDSLNYKTTVCYCEGELRVPSKEELQYLKSIKW